MKNKTLEIILILFLFSLNFANAAVVKTKGADFLKFIPSARASAIGGAATASSPKGTESSYWNPAINADYQEKEIQISYIKWWDNSNFGYIGLTLGRVGINATFLQRDEFILIDSINSSPEDDLTSSELAVGISYGLLMNENLGVGIIAKYIRRELNDTATTFAGDITGLYKISEIDGLRFAASIQNIGPKVGIGEEKDNLPMKFRLGAAYSPTYLLGLTGAIEIVKPIDASMNMVYGGEIYPIKLYSWLTMSNYIYRTPRDLPEDLVVIRFGHDGSLTDFFDGLSAGIGVNFSKFEFDYTFKPYSDQNDSHRISLIVSF